MLWQSCGGVAVCLGSQQGCLPGAQLAPCTTAPRACVFVLAWSLLALLFLPLTASSSAKQLRGAVPALQGASGTGGEASEMSCSGATSSAPSTGPCPGRDMVPSGLSHTHLAKSRPCFPRSGIGCQILLQEFAKSVLSSSLLGMLGQRVGSSVPQRPCPAPGRFSLFPRAMQSQFIFMILLDLHWSKNESQ